jgi:nitroimidazol reductase NimA-like FMN-containing flavoprotein (pyridoxamine 5'-phosphate oxidase superfamily)
VTTEQELQALAREVIDTNRYMTLGTADESGRPWVSPLYYTPDHYRDFYWVSSPDAQHSRNLRLRPEVSIVVFDSQVRIGGAQAVYMTALAQDVPEPDLELCASVFRARFPEVRSIGLQDLREPGSLRLYRATAIEHSVLIRGSDPVWGRGVDSRKAVTLSSA